MKRDFYERYSRAIILLLVFVAPIAFAGARRALNHNRNRLEQWLPADYPETRVYNEFRKLFHGEEFVLVSWDGCELDDQRVRLLSAKLVAGEDSLIPDELRYFSKAISGPTIIDTLSQPPINMERAEAIERLRGSLIGPNGKQTCLVLSLSPLGKQNLTKTVVRVYDIAQKECAIPHDQLHMGGPPSDNAALDLAGIQSVYTLATMASLIGLTISWWCLRSVKLVIIVFAAGLYSAMASLAIVWYSGFVTALYEAMATGATGSLAGGEMNAILLTMPSLVYVAAISGAIHLANYYRDSIQADGLAGAPMRAIRHACLPLTLATSTTAVGLFTLCYSELVPIQLFGFYSAVGVIVSAAFLFLFMPAAFQLWPLKESAVAHESEQKSWIDPTFFSGWENVGHWILRNNGIVTAAGVAVIVFCGLGMAKMQTSVQLMGFFSKKAKVVTDYQWLEENLGELVPMEVVLEVDPAKTRLNFLERMELVQRVQDAIEAIEVDEYRVVGSSLSAATFAKLPEEKPAEKPKTQRSSSLGRFGKTLGRVAGVRDTDVHARTVRNQELEKHRDRILEGDYLKESNGHEMWRISARLSALKNIDYAKFVSELQEHVEPLLAQTNDKNGAEGVTAIYTGLVPLVYKAQNSLLDGLITGFVTDLVLVIAAIIVIKRSLSAGLILMVPSVFPPVVVFGMMGWLGIIVEIGSVMAPSVALGVSVDDIVHFMLRYRRAVAAGLDRKAAVMDAYHHCGRAMYQSWGVIGLGLSVFALSPFTPTQRFGYMMIALLTATLLANLLVLPALLAGPLGVLFARGVKIEPPEAPPASAEPTAAAPPPVLKNRRIHDESRIEPAHR